MNQQAADTAFLLYLQVKVATALLLLKAKPEGTNIREYVMSLQYKFRAKTSRYNLYLEKQIFQNQFILLLPELKVYSIEHQLQNYEYPELTEYDKKFELFQDYVILSSSADCVMSNTSEIRTILRKIESNSRFIDSIVKIKLLSKEKRDILLVDLIKILCCLEVPTICDRDSIPARNLILSHSLFHYLINSIDAERMITRGLFDIISLLEEYLEGEREIRTSAKALKTVQYANRIIFECIMTFPDITVCCKQTIGSFLRKTLTNLLFTKDKILNRLEYKNWYSAFGVWKKEEFTCVEMINALVSSLKATNDNFYPQVTQLQSSSLECNLLLLKRLLISFHKMYVLDIANPKNLNIDQWEETLRATVVESISQQSNTVRLAWHCLKLVVSFKLLLS